MAITYTCDRCGTQLTRREDDRGGAHHITFRDAIPWAREAVHGATVPFPAAVDLCGACCAALRDWLTTPLIRSAT